MGSRQQGDPRDQIGGRPSEGLRRQLRPDEEIKWVSKKDMKTNILGAIAGVLPLMVFMLFFGAFAFAFVASSTGSTLLGFLAFLVLAVGVPFAQPFIAYLNVKKGGVEYAATDDRFIKYEEKITSTDVDSTPINRVRDAEYDEDFGDKILGTGDIRIEGAQGDSLYFNDAPEADLLLRAVRQDIAEAETVDVRNQAAMGYGAPQGQGQGQARQPQGQQGQQGQGRQGQGRANQNQGRGQENNYNQN